MTPPQMRAFASQLTYRPYGHLMCTPLCMLVADGFVRGKVAQSSDPFVCFCPRVMHACMHAAHRLYSEHFSARKEMVMIEEIMPMLPDDRQVERLQLAGVLQNRQYDAGFDDGKTCIASLTTVLQTLAEVGLRERAAVVVTTGGHTTCYLSNGSGRVYHFDSLPARLVDITHKTLLEQAQCAGALTREYSALVMVDASSRRIKGDAHRQ